MGLAGLAGLASTKQKTVSNNPSWGFWMPALLVFLSRLPRVSRDRSHLHKPRPSAQQLKWEQEGRAFPTDLRTLRNEKWGGHTWLLLSSSFRSWYRLMMLHELEGEEDVSLSQSFVSEFTNPSHWSRLPKQHTCFS